jgi:hypothetical protein
MSDLAIVIDGFLVLLVVGTVTILVYSVRRPGE